MNNHDEILIQRCIDNELTTEERRTLLKRLDEQPEGWKSLACGYMEDQLFANAAMLPAQSAVAPEPVREIRTTSRRAHWFHRPTTSVVLTVCVAFVMGLLVRGQYAGSDAAGLQIAGNDSGETAAAAAGLPMPGDTTAGEGSVNGDIKVQLVGDGRKSQALPLYVAEQNSRNADREWQQISDFLKRVAQERNRPGPYIVITMRGQRLIIPVTGQNLR